MIHLWYKGKVYFKVICKSLKIKYKKIVRNIREIDLVIGINLEKENERGLNQMKRNERGQNQKIEKEKSHMIENEKNHMIENVKKVKKNLNQICHLMKKNFK